MEFTYNLPVLLGFMFSVVYLSFLTQYQVTGKEWELLYCGEDPAEPSNDEWLLSCTKEAKCQLLSKNQVENCDLSENM